MSSGAPIDMERTVVSLDYYYPSGKIYFFVFTVKLLTNHIIIVLRNQYGPISLRCLFLGWLTVPGTYLRKYFVASNLKSSIIKMHMLKYC